MSNEIPEFVEVEGVKYVPSEEDAKVPKEVDGEKVVFVPKKEEDDDTKAPEGETPAQKQSRLKRQTERHAKQHPNLYKEDKKEVKDDDKKVDPKLNKLDHGQKAFLQSHELEIKTSEEFEFVEAEMESTGKTLDQLVDSPYFKEEITKMREAKDGEDAVPGDKDGRGGNGAANTVDYWVTKGELPPDVPENRKLRVDIVKARREGAKTKSSFTDQSVVSKNSK